MNELIGEGQEMDLSRKSRSDRRKDRKYSGNKSVSLLERNRNPDQELFYKKYILFIFKINLKKIILIECLGILLTLHNRTSPCHFRIQSGRIQYLPMKLFFVNNRPNVSRLCHRRNKIWLS